ncbi:hypothetical protein [Streptosporangium carneum]|uniref:hypothetical protein n=1 Tax=Streptosporangium carneum TaxID=47481 RepID=UPI0022F2D0E0|nr:hypothetical protein [Streptosporangium carneum]
METDNALDYDYLAGDRQERAILRHMVLSLLVGMVLGAVGALLAYGPHLIHSIYEPYAYVLLVVVVGRSAAGFGWAALTSALATFGPLISLLAASLFESGARFLNLSSGSSVNLGSNGLTMNLTVVTIATFGVLAYFTRREDGWGDLACGVLAGVVAVDGLDKTLSGGPEYVPGYWPWNTLLVATLVAGLLFALRRGNGVARSGFVALVVLCAAFVFAVAF